MIFLLKTFPLLSGSALDQEHYFHSLPFSICLGSLKPNLLLVHRNIIKNLLKLFNQTRFEKSF